jgi:hypothetical protein
MTLSVRPTLLDLMALALSSVSLLGEAPAMGQTPTPIIRAKCHVTTSRGVGGLADSIAHMDLGKSQGGELFLTRGETLWRWRRNTRGQWLLSKETVPKAPESERLVQLPKWRGGAYWARDKVRVLRWDTTRKIWQARFTLSEDPVDFEIASNGDLLLLGTQKHLVEVFSVSETKPHQVVDYPALEVDSAADKAHLPLLWSDLRLAVNDEFVVIYAVNLGRLYAFDTVQNSLKEFSVPWEPLKTRGIATAIKKDGALVMSDVPSQYCLQLIPDDGLSLRLVYAIRAFKVDRFSKAEGAVIAIPELTFQEKGPPKLYSYEIHLIQGTLSAPRPEPGLAFPVWLNGRRELMGLDLLLKPQTP